MEKGIGPLEDLPYGTVTYHIYNDNIQEQTFLYEESILNPSFSPTKEDYLFYANCNVTLTISGDVSTGALDGWVTGKVMLYVNDSLKQNYVYKYYDSNYSSPTDINTTIDLPAGSRCSIRCFDEADDPNMRFHYSLNITFTAVPK